MMPTENMLSSSLIAILVLAATSVPIMPVIIVVVNATMVVVTAISALHMKAKAI